MSQCMFVGDLSFEEFSKTSLVEELMASDELEADEDGEISVATEKEASSVDRDGRSLSAPDDPSAAVTEQAENFAAELSNIQTARKRNLMSTSLSVSSSSTFSVPNMCVSCIVSKEGGAISYSPT